MTKNRMLETGQNLKWDHFEILAKGRSDTHCKIKETLLIQELKPTLGDTVSSEKLICISLHFLMQTRRIFAFTRDLSWREALFLLHVFW